MDYCDSLADPLAAGNCLVVHHWRIYSHSAGDCGHNDLDPANQRQKADELKYFRGLKDAFECCSL